MPEIVSREDIRKWSEIMELVDSEDRRDIFPWLDSKEREEGEIISEEGEIAGHACCAFVHIRECLKIWYEGENEDALFKGIMDHREFLTKCIHLALQLKFRLKGDICRSSDLDGTITDRTDIFGLHESVREECMYLEEKPTIILELPTIADEVFDRFFMIEDHVGFFFVLSLGNTMVLDEDFSIEIVIRITLQMTRCVREINEDCLEETTIIRPEVRIERDTLRNPMEYCSLSGAKE